MKRFFLRLGLAVLVIALAAAGGFAWWANHPLALNRSPVEVVIKPNSGVASVGRQIQRGGVAMDPRLSFGDVREDNVAGIYDGPFPWETTFGFNLAGMVGHDFFKPYAVTFDFETMRIFLVSPPSSP